MDMNHWHYILAGIMVLCATAVIIISILTNRTIPEVLISSGILIIGSIISYLYGNKQTNGSSKS